MPSDDSRLSLEVSLYRTVIFPTIFLKVRWHFHDSASLSVVIYLVVASEWTLLIKKKTSSLGTQSDTPGEHLENETNISNEKAQKLWR